MADDNTVHQNGVENGEPDGDLPSQQQPAEEKELTLTDHLNKRLLQSFFNRLEDGSFQVPASATSTSRHTEASEESNDFDEG